MMCPSASITNSAIVVPPDLMLLNCRGHLAGRMKTGRNWFWISARKILVERSLQENFLIFFLFDFVIFFAEGVHLHEFDFIGIGQRRINTFTIDELAGLCLNRHALFVEKEVDESLARIGAGSLGSKADVLTVAQHIVVADIIEIGALFVIG